MLTLENKKSNKSTNDNDTNRSDAVGGPSVFHSITNNSDNKRKVDTNNKTIPTSERTTN